MHVALVLGMPNNIRNHTSFLLVLGTAFAFTASACGGPEEMQAQSETKSAATASTSAYHPCWTCFLARVTVTAVGANATIWDYAYQGANQPWGARTDYTCPSGQTCTFYVGWNDLIDIFTPAAAGNANVTSSGIACQMEPTYLWEFGPPAHLLSCSGTMTGPMNVNFSFN
jgi:hypothetical protein